MALSIATDYQIDNNPPVNVDMRDYSVPARDGGNATVPAGVVGHWISTTNQQHTIRVTIPPGGSYAVVDMFM